MKRTHPGKRPQKVAMALGAVLVTAGCATAPAQDGANPADQSSRYDGGVEQLLLYCGKLRDGGEYATAAGICDRAHSIAPTDPRPLMMMGEIFTRMELQPRAAAAYLAVLEQTPHDIEARYLLGKTYIAMGYYDRALQELQFALSQSPEDARLYNALGIANGMLGNQADARLAFEHGLKVTPDDIPLRNNLGLAMVLEGHHEQGIAMLQAVAVDPNANATSIRNLRLAEGIVQSAKADRALADAGTAEDGAAPGTSQLASAAAIPAEFGSTPEPAMSEIQEAAPAPLAMPDREPAPNAPASIPHEPVTLTEALSPAAGDLQMADSGKPVYLDSDSGPESAAAYSDEDQSEEPADDTDIADAQPEDTDTDGMSAAAIQGESSEELNLTSMPHPILGPGYETPASATPAPTGEMRSVLAADANPAKSQSPATATAPAVTQTASLGGDDIYSVQLASYRSADRAQDGWRQIRASALDLLQDVDPVIRRSDLGPEKGIYFRLRTKPASKAAANQLCSSLQARGLSCLTIKEDPAATEETAMPTAAKS